MDETQGLLPKLKDLGMENKYADGKLLLRPELFYYNQGLTLKHQKATADKFEKARILFTLSSKMVSEEYMSTLFSEEVIEKLKPQVVSMHGIDLPPELMHWRDSVGIIVKDSVRNSASLTEQMAILRILSESENGTHKSEQGSEQCSLADEDERSAKKVCTTAQPVLSSLERLKRFARNRGSLSRKDLDQLNSLSIDTLVTNSASSSRRPSRVTSAANTPTAPRASDARKMDFSALTSASICMRHASPCPSARRGSSMFLQRDFTEDGNRAVFGSDTLPRCSEPDDLNTDTINCPEKKESDADLKGISIESCHDKNNDPSRKSSPGSSPKVSIKDYNIDATFDITESGSPRDCIYNKVREDCSWHSDMVTFAEPRSDMSFSDSDYEELLYEILAEYRLEASNESSSDGKHLAKTQMYYSNEIPVDENTAGYRSYLATFRKRLSTPGVLDRCAVESKSLRQGRISIGQNTAAHERATFDTDYEAVRSRFTEHMQIDISIPAALANTIPISTSYSGPTTYKSFILDKHVDGIIVANAADDSATLYIQPAHDHCMAHTKKTIDKLYSQDSFIKRNYTIECREPRSRRFLMDNPVSHNEFSRYSKTGFNSEQEEANSHNFRDSSIVSTASKSRCSGTTAKPNSRVGERLPHTDENKLEVGKNTTDCATPIRFDAQYEDCKPNTDRSHMPGLQSECNKPSKDQPESVEKAAGTQKLTLSMLDPVSFSQNQNEPITVQPSLPSLNNTTISVGGAVRSLARTIQDQMPEKILSHSIVSSNVRAIDTGKAIHRHSVLMKSTLPIESRVMQEDFTNEAINEKICELNASTLLKKPKVQISNICDPIPTGVMHMGASSSDVSGSTVGARQQSLNFFEKNAMLRYEKFAGDKKERRVLDSWQLTSVYGPNLIPFGGSNTKHSAVYVDIRDVVKAREQIKNRFRTAADTSINYSTVKRGPEKEGTSSTMHSTTYTKKDKTISVCAPRVSTRDHADWKLEKYSKRGFSQK